jgi:hypothetical protein
VAEVEKTMRSEKSRETESPEIEVADASGAVPCDACGAAMKPMGHCKYWCLRCGFLRTCNDVI